MKKLLLSVVLGAAVVSANAQEFKPTKGMRSAEFGLTGGLNDAKFDLNEGLLRGRYFKSDKVAYRLGLGVLNINDTRKVYGTGTFAGKEGSIKENNTAVAVNLGIEKHFEGTDRLSPYIGADLILGMENSKVTTENSNGNIYLDGTSSEVKGPGKFSAGVRGVIGADYYIAKHVYLGVEAGLGLGFSTNGKTKTSTTVGGVTTPVEIKSTGNALAIAHSMVTGIRIGFIF